MLEILTQHFGASQIHMPQLRTRLQRLNMHQNPDHSFQPTSDVNLLSAQQWNIDEPEGACTSSRKRTGQIRSGGQDEADDIVIGHVILNHHCVDEFTDGFIHFLRVILLQAGCTAQTPQSKPWFTHRHIVLTVIDPSQANSLIETAELLGTEIAHASASQITEA